jgi:metal-responsive CopG/Arc/MetJ family transcriptional regulator
MKSIARKDTVVISTSLPKSTVEALDSLLEKRGTKNRSVLISELISKELEDTRWERIYRKGAKAAKRAGIVNEDDVDKLIHAARF